MKFTYTKSAFEMPDGKYLAKFNGCTLRELQPGEQPRLGMDGKPMPPGMTWDFEIVEGEHKGKKTDKLTGRMPTPKSGCGKMLACIADTVLKDGVEVDLDNYVGKLYRVTVIENRVQDNPGPVRADHAPATIGANGAPVVAGTFAGLVPDALWDAHDGSNSIKGITTAAIRELIANGASPTTIRMKPVGAPVSEAKTAAEWGLTVPIVSDEIPW